MPPLSLLPPTRGEGPGKNDDTDAALIRRVAAGDRLALELLYRPYYRRLERFLIRLTRRVDVIEEVINDTFWIVWQKSDQFRGESRVSTWIVGIAYRCALKALRDHGAGPQDAGEQDEAQNASADPNSAYELSDWLAKGMSRLTVEQRVTLELAYGAGHSLEEIASITQCQVSTVKARMFHARVKLRNLLPALAGGAAVPGDPEKETG